MTQALVLNEVQNPPVLKHLVRIIGQLVSKLKSVEQRLDESVSGDMQETVGDLLEYSEWFSKMVQQRVDDRVSEDMQEALENVVHYELRNNNLLDSAVNDVFENFDVSEHVRSEFGSSAFDSAVENVIDHYDFDLLMEEAVSNALYDIDWNDKFADYMRDYDFGSDITNAINEALESRFKPMLDRMAQDAVRRALITAANNMQGE